MSNSGGYGMGLRVDWTRPLHGGELSSPPGAGDHGTTADDHHPGSGLLPRDLLAGVGAGDFQHPHRHHQQLHQHQHQHHHHHQQHQQQQPRQLQQLQHPLSHHPQHQNQSPVASFYPADFYNFSIDQLGFPAPSQGPLQQPHHYGHPYPFHPTSQGADSGVHFTTTPPAAARTPSISVHSEPNLPDNAKHYGKQESDNSPIISTIPLTSPYPDQRRHSSFGPACDRPALSAHSTSPMHSEVAVISPQQSSSAPIPRLDNSASLQSPTEKTPPKLPRKRARGKNNASDQGEEGDEDGPRKKTKPTRGRPRLSVPKDMCAIQVCAAASRSCV